jgi:hypothetical protein
VKVRDLKDILSGLPEGAEVFLSSDAEGNQISSLEDFNTPYASRVDMVHGRLEGVYYEEDLEDWTREEIEDLETVVVLWPV